jgi:hypothetical protein
VRSTEIEGDSAGLVPASCQPSILNEFLERIFAGSLQTGSLQTGSLQTGSLQNCLAA